MSSNVMKNNTLIVLDGYDLNVVLFKILLQKPNSPLKYFI